MSERKTVVPAIPAVGDPSNPVQVGSALAKLKEATEVGLGRRGDPLDRFATLRDLKDAGIAKVTTGGTLSKPLARPGGVPGAPLFEPGDPDFGGGNYATPPGPQGVTARGIGPDSIMVSWSPPNYTNHAYAEVFVIVESQANPSNYYASMLAQSSWDINKPHSSSNTHSGFAGTASGTIFMHRDLLRFTDPALSELDNALSPTARRYFVRFVSYANVAGPFAPISAGARGVMSTDPIEVLNGLTTNVQNTALYNRLQRIIYVDPQDIPALTTAGSLTRMFRNDFQALSEQLVGFEDSLIQTLATVTRSEESIESLWTVRMNTTVDGVVHAAGFGLGLTVDTDGTAESAFIVAADQFAIIGVPVDGDETPPLIPFIVDTERGVVGIRGSLIVDGLVRSQVGDFNVLLAESAFIDHIRAVNLDANVVVAQRIIAGVPPSGDTGRVTDEFINAYSSNYIVELNKPGIGRSPFRYYKPNGVGGIPHVIAELTQSGDFMLGGNLSVGENAVIATSGDNVFSTGGAGFDGDYALWIGPKSVYGVVGEGRNEEDGLLWVKEDGRAGFNADLFLGENALSLPMLAAAGQGGASIISTGGGPRAGTAVYSAVSSSALTVRALRSGQPPLVWVQVSGYLASQATGSGDNKRFRLTAQLVGSPSATSGHLVQSLEMDDYFPEAWAYSVSAAITVPPGNYYVRLDLEVLENRPMSIINGWNAIAMQVTTNAGLV